MRMSNKWDQHKKVTIYNMFLSALNRWFDVVNEYLENTWPYVKSFDVQHEQIKFKNWVPLRAMKTFIREKMGHTT